MDNSNIVYKIVEDKVNMDGIHTFDGLEMHIRVAYLNMLHSKGLIPDNVHSIALNKVTKGVVR